MRRTILLLFSTALLAACLTTERVSIGEKITNSGAVTGQQIFLRAMPTKGDVRDDVHGKELWFAYGAILGVNGTNANGVATAHFLQDETYVLGLQLNIVQPETGTFYEAWLVTGSAESWISLGHLTTSMPRTSLQTLRFSEKIDAREHLKIAVTSEKDDGNAAPGRVIAEGVLKVTKR